MRTFVNNLSLQDDREQIITELCQKYKTNKLNYKKFSNLTEGYTIGDLVQFFEKAVFYAYRTGITENLNHSFFLMSIT